jgi:pilus assembly protein Flp/PilA
MSAFVYLCKVGAAVGRFRRSEDGPTAVEYAVMLSMIVSACMLAIDSVGTKATKSFKKVATSLKTGS